MRTPNDNCSTPVNNLVYESTSCFDAQGRDLKNASSTNPLGVTLFDRKVNDYILFRPLISPDSRVNIALNTGTKLVELTAPLLTEWRGIWSQQEYTLNEQVIDEGWLAIANTTTEERPAPQKVGEAFNIYDGTIGTTTANARQVLFGNKYTFTANVFFEGWRIYLIAGNKYFVYLIRDPDGANIISQVLTFIAQTSGWLNLTAQSLILQAGSTYAALAAVSEPAVVPVTFSGNWNYTQPQNATVPVSGGITQPKSVPSLMYISNFDNAAVDRSAQLATLNVGDTIETSTNLWAVQSISPQVGYYILGVSPALLNVSLGVQNFTFETKSTATLTYALDPGYWTANPPTVATVQGLLGIDIPYSAIVPNDTAYGIGLLVQNLVISSDWDIQAYSGTNSGSGGSTPGGGTVDSVTDDGNGVVTVDNTDPVNPVVEFSGINVSTGLSGNGTAGSPVVNTITQYTNAMAISAVGIYSYTIAFTGQIVSAVATGEQIVYSFPIPASTLGAGDALEIYFWHRKTSGAGTLSTKTYLNSANTVGGAGATAYSTSGGTTTNGDSVTILFPTANTQVGRPGTSSVPFGTFGSAMTTGALSVAAIIYVQITMNKSVAADGAQLEGAMIRVHKYRV